MAHCVYSSKSLKRTGMKNAPGESTRARGSGSGPRRRSARDKGTTAASPPPSSASGRRLIRASCVCGTVGGGSCAAVFPCSVLRSDVGWELCQGVGVESSVLTEMPAAAAYSCARFKVEHRGVKCACLYVDACACMECLLRYGSKPKTGAKRRKGGSCTEMASESGSRGQYDKMSVGIPAVLTRYDEHISRVNVMMTLT